MLSPYHPRSATNALWLLPVCVLVACAGPTQEPSSAVPDVTLTIVGQALIEHDPREFLDAPLRSITPILRRADAVFTNLEVAVAGAGCDCEPTRDDVYFHGAGPEVLDYLGEIGVSLLSLANNHAWDYGTSGVLSAIAEVEARGFTHSGSGVDVSEATAPSYRQVGRFTVSLVSAASVNTSQDARATATRAGLNMLQPGDTADWDRNLSSIRVARAESDVVVAYQHFQTDAEPGWQEEWARAAIDAGADIYVSHGEPTLMGVEAYRGGLILYGLGNFIFQTKTEPGRYPADVWQSVLAEVVIGGEGVKEVTFTPVVLDSGEQGPLFLETRGFPEVADAETGRSILDRLLRLSAPYETSLHLSRGRATLLLSEQTGAN
jgi:poly-gamma-glutamate capsule biosynthesis protein CapA/YwtB (metallophosphatase superfamily)